MGFVVREPSELPAAIEEAFSDPDDEVTWSASSRDVSDSRGRRSRWARSSR